MAVSSTMPILMALPNSFHRVVYACRSSSRCAIALSTNTRGAALSVTGALPCQSEPGMPCGAGEGRTS